MHNMQKLSK